MRTAFIQTLLKLAEGDERITLVVGDLGFGVIEGFCERFPKQFLNAGVAEQNMTGIAAGMALTGKIVFTYSIANFPVIRCLEQIRNDVCYHRANVKVVSVGGGFAYGPLGMSHHAIEDLAIMRAMPDITVVAPGDPIETAGATRAIAQYDGPCYLRLGRAGDPVVHSRPISFQLGKAIMVRDGQDLTLISTGGMLQTALQSAELLAKDGIHVRVLSMHTVKPLDVEQVLTAAADTHCIATLEDHSICGGLGSAVAEVLAEFGAQVLFKRIGLQSACFSFVGSQDHLRARHGLTAAAVVHSLQELVRLAGTPKRTQKVVRRAPLSHEATITRVAPLKPSLGEAAQRRGLVPTDQGGEMAYIVPFVDPRTHYRRFKAEIDAAITGCLSRGDLINRKQLRDFESHLADFVGTRYAVGLNSGYHALYFSLVAAGIGPNDEVITVGHTFVATVSAIVSCGATPVLIEVGKDYNMDSCLLEPAITPRTKAILPVHLNGRMCDIDRIMAIAEKHNLVVIEDAAQSLGAQFNGRNAGAIGLTGCWSFYPFKILGGFGDGGAITTNDPDIARTIALLRYNGEDRETGEYYYHGQTALLDNVQAAVLDIKLRHLPQWIEHRRSIAELYHRKLQGIPNLLLPHFDDQHHFDIYQNYVVRSKERDALREYLKARGVETLVSWPKPMWQHARLGLQDPHLSGTESICREVLSLPMSAETTTEQVEITTQHICDYFSGHQRITEKQEYVSSCFPFTFAE